METWKPIVSIPVYEGASRGRVKKQPCCRGFNSMEHIKNATLSADGYLLLNWKTSDGKQHSRAIHRLVAEAFIPNPEHKDTVNHIDGDKTNNSVDNLEWATRREQLTHAYAHSLRVSHKGSENCNSKLSQDDVMFIRTYTVKRSRTHGIPSMAKKFGVSYETIYNVLSGKTYKEEGSTTIPNGSTPK